MLPSILTTARLRLRPIRPEDAPRMAALANDFDIVRMTRSMPFPYAQSDAEAFIARALAPGATVVNRVIDDGAFQGVMGIVPEPSGRRAELGYWLARDAWGKGYATEAGRAMLAAGFAHSPLDEIHAAAFIENPASSRVLEKLGFAPAGEAPGESRARGPGAWPCRLYRLTRAQWAQGEST